MASVSDLNKKLRLEEERSAVLNAISKEVGEERRALERVLAKIELELNETEPTFSEVSECPSSPVLPNSQYTAEIQKFHKRRCSKGKIKQEQHSSTFVAPAPQYGAGVFVCSKNASVI